MTGKEEISGEQTDKRFMIQTFLFRMEKGGVYSHTIYAGDIQAAIGKWIQQIEFLQETDYSYNPAEVKNIRLQYENGKMKQQLEKEPFFLHYQQGTKPMIVNINKVNKGTPDFIATVTYLTTAQGGRKGITASGYKPLIKFDGREELTSCEQLFVDRDNVFPGETAVAEMRILSKSPFRKSLAAGQRFELFEALRLIAHGELVEITNPVLKQ